MSVIGYVHYAANSPENVPRHLPGRKPYGLCPACHWGMLGHWLEIGPNMRADLREECPALFTGHSGARFWLRAPHLPRPIGRGKGRAWGGVS